MSISPTQKIKTEEESGLLQPVPSPRDRQVLDSYMQTGCENGHVVVTVLYFPIYSLYSCLD